MSTLPILDAPVASSPELIPQEAPTSVYINGVDVSNWQPFTDAHYDGIANAGYKYAAIRFAVGDYYTDPRAATHWNEFGERGFLRMPYFVIAPADSYGRQISAAQHMQRFLDAFGDRESELPWVLDCELARGQSKAYITALNIAIVDACYAQLNRYPIIYTRQNWWDLNVDANPRWSQCPLWAARYTNVDIGGPWGDGWYVFRDWTTWHFWQWTSHGIIPPYTGNIDLDRWNGDYQSLVDFAGGVTLQGKVDILWREAAIAGWNLEP